MRELNHSSLSDFIQADIDRFKVNLALYLCRLEGKRGFSEQVEEHLHEAAVLYAAGKGVDYVIEGNVAMIRQSVHNVLTRLELGAKDELREKARLIVKVEAKYTPLPDVDGVPMANIAYKISIIPKS